MRQAVIQKAEERQGRQQPNLTGIPTQMKMDFEQRSGLSFDDVRVHYNSDKPRKIGALAYTQGTQVHIGPGQERYLKHELGHVVQQKTKQILHTKIMNGLLVNDDAGLEAEAERYSGSKSIAGRNDNRVYTSSPVVQGLFVPEKILAEIGALSDSRNPNISTLISLVRTHIRDDFNVVPIKTGDTVKYQVYYGSRLVVTAKKVSTIVAQIVKAVRDQNNAEDTFAKNIGFGFELTFNNETDFKFTAATLDEPSYGAPITAGKNLIAFAQKIVTLMPGKRSRVHEDIDVTSVELSNGDKKWKNKYYNAQKITVSFYSKSRGAWVWTVNVDLDPGCIEIQLRPFTIKDQEIYRPFINAIFLAATECSLVADPNPHTGGGGHISIDAQAFEGEPHFLLNFMAEYNRLASQSSPNWANECGDVDNAPLMAELGTLGAFREVCNRFDLNPRMSLKELVAQIKNNVYQGHFTDTLINTLRESSSSGTVTPSDATHYQAINLDHLLKEDDSARLEMRRFNAQQSSSKMFDQMKDLAQLLIESRQKKRLYP